MAHSIDGVRWRKLGTALALALVSPPAGMQADEQDRPLPEPTEAGSLPEGAEARPGPRDPKDAFTQACRYQDGDRCQALRDRAHVLRRQEAALERYLEGGLREECRRNGCLPGWIRG